MVKFCIITRKGFPGRDLSLSFSPGNSPKRSAEGPSDPFSPGLTEQEEAGVLAELLSGALRGSGTGPPPAPCDSLTTPPLLFWEAEEMGLPGPSVPCDSAETAVPTGDETGGSRTGPSAPRDSGTAPTGDEMGSGTGPSAPRTPTPGAPTPTAPTPSAPTPEEEGEEEGTATTTDGGGGGGEGETELFQSTHTCLSADF